MEDVLCSRRRQTVLFHCRLRVLVLQEVPTLSEGGLQSTSSSRLTLSNGDKWLLNVSFPFSIMYSVLQSFNLSVVQRAIDVVTCVWLSYLCGTHWFISPFIVSRHQDKLRTQLTKVDPQSRKDKLSKIRQMSVA